MIEPKAEAIKLKSYNPPTSNRDNYLRLDFNENTMGCSPKVISELRKINSKKLAAYPEYSKLIKALAGYCKVNLDEILPTNGTDEAIKTVIETYIGNDKDEIIIPVPTYAMFKFYAQLSGAAVKEVLYQTGLEFPAKNLLLRINKKTRIIVIVSPNNPTGTSVKLKDVIRIIKIAKQNNAIVLLDEAYYEFSGKTCMPLVQKYPNLIILRTFSKAFGLAGLRVGYIISKNQNIKILKKVLSPYSVNQIAAICAIAALKDLNYAKKYVNEVNKSKSILYGELNCLGIKYYASNANFILLRIGKNAGNICEFFRKSGVLVRNRSADPLLEGCVRITLGTVPQTKKVIKILRKFRRR